MAVFAFSIIITTISIIPVIFPAAIPLGTSTPQIPRAGTPSPLEPGVLAAPLIITSIIVFALTLAYFKGRLPDSISKRLHSIFTFETSKKTTIIVMVLFLAIYIGLSAQELASEEKWLDNTAVKARLQTWNMSNVSVFSDPHVSYFLDYISHQAFGNYRVIPFVSSIILVILVFYTTRQITQKNFAGLAATAIILQSRIFTDYDTSYTYPDYWSTLYLASLYIINKKWSVASIVPYFLSVFAKALTAVFLPMSLYYTYRSNTSKKAKIITILSYGVIGIAMLGLSNIISSTGAQTEPGQSSFWQGFASFAFQLRFDTILVIFLLPLVVGLFIASKKGTRQADAIMFLIAWVLFSAPLLTGFTDQTNQPYRFLPLVVFFAMGVGVLLSKKD